MPVAITFFLYNSLPILLTYAESADLATLYPTEPTASLEAIEPI
jgi:hypothetical protein